MSGDFLDRRAKQLDEPCKHDGDTYTTQGTDAVGGQPTEAHFCSGCNKLLKIVELGPADLSLEARRIMRRNGWTSRNTPNPNP